MALLFVCSYEAVSLNFSHLPPAPPPLHPPVATAAVCRAWTCHGSNNRELVNNLYSGNLIKSSEVRDALLLVDRANYVPTDRKPSAYDDAPLSIGFGQTISAPHMHASAMEELLPAIKGADPNLPIRILDVGSGSGYLSAVFGRLLSVLNLKDGKVYGIDCVRPLVHFSKDNMQKDDMDLLSSGKVSLSVGDGWNGLPSEGPFQAIHVGAGADTLPRDLANQLALGGRMVCPIETKNGYQGFYRIDRVNQSADGKFHESDFEYTELFPVRYVPLVHP